MKKQTQKRPAKPKHVANDDLAKITGGAGNGLGGTPVNPVGPHG